MLRGSGPTAVNSHTAIAGPEHTLPNITSIMKQHLTIGALALGLLSCKKDDATPITTDFNQKFSLYYRQQAALPTASPPELSLEVTELRYTICPKNANCFVADFAAPTLRITDAQGQSQQVTIPANTFGNRTPDWIDTASFRANGRRYLLTYVDWKAKGDYHSAKREDIFVELRVTKPN
jgi:hypothetical protein